MAASSTPGAGYGGATPLGAGAGRGNGGDDTEHHRRYLIAPDPDSLFGCDEVVAPAVIGADDDSDWEEE